MKKSIGVVLISVIAVSAAFTQTKARPKPRPKPTPAASKPAGKAAPVSELEKGYVVGRTYTNGKFRFEIVFPDTWLIPDDDFEAYMKSKGYDLSLRAPDSLAPQDKAAVNKAAKNVTVLLTAYRSLPGTTNNAIMRISVEDLSANPQIKDAVDYFDATRSTFKAIKLPADFQYSETQAEQLGTMQFAYLDTASSAGKKRMYATVRDGFAIMFTLSYTADDDLTTMRRILEEGNFNLK